MGIIFDSNVLIRAEKLAQAQPFTGYEDNGEAYISAITASELLVGVHLANTEARRNQRRAFVESLLVLFPVLEFTMATARIQAELYASLRQKGELMGAHDLIIAATALQHGFGVLTSNTREFERVAGLKVVAFPQ